MLGSSDADPGWWIGQREIERAAAFNGQLPMCMLPYASDCFGCPLESASPCPVRVDADYRSYLNHLRGRYLAYERKRIEQLDVLKTILRRHKLPLHWEYLALLAIREAPTLFASAHSIKALVHFNPDKFRMVGEGVFALAE